MQPTRVELRRLNALPDRLALLHLDEMMADHPLDLFMRQLQKKGDEPDGKDRFGADSGLLAAVSQKQYFANKKLSSMFVVGDFHS